MNHLQIPAGDERVGHVAETDPVPVLELEAYGLCASSVFAEDVRTEERELVAVP